MASRLFVSEEEAGAFIVCSDAVSLTTERTLQIVDITPIVLERVRRSRVRHGMVNVQTRHTTTAIVVNEDEPLLHEDLQALLERWAPTSALYQHDDLSRRGPGLPADESLNGHAHCRAVLLGAFATLNIVGGAVQLGRWQRIFLVELDGPRRREVSVTVMGAP